MDIWQCLEIFLVVTTGKRGRMLLAPSKQRPGILWNSQQCTEQSFTTKNYPVQNVNRTKVEKEIDPGWNLEFISVFLAVWPWVGYFTSLSLSWPFPHLYFGDHHKTSLWACGRHLITNIWNAWLGLAPYNLSCSSQHSQGTGRDVDYLCLLAAT